MQYYAGIDIGNTKTEYLLSDENGNIVSRVLGQGANYQWLGERETIEVLEKGVLDLVERAGLSSIDQIANAFIGAAGADSKRDFGNLQNIFSSVFRSVPFKFENDGLIALKNGIEDLNGIVVTCGTGNANFAMNKECEILRIGGLTGELGDVLGADAMRNAICSTAVRSDDGRSSPSILPEVLGDALELDHLYDLINIDFSPSLTEQIISEFFRCAGEGDGLCLSVTWDFAREVLTIVNEMVVRLFTESDPLRIVLDGPVFSAGYQPFMKMIDLAIGSKYDAEIIIPTTPSILGAVYFAFEGAEGSLSREMIGTIKRSYGEIQASVSKERENTI